MRQIAHAISVILVASAPLGGASAAAPPGAYYKLAHDMELGGPGFYDYLTYDAANARLYASHFDRITVLDTAHDKVVGEVAPFNEAHGIAIVAKLGKGFAASGGDGKLKVFDLKTLKVTSEIAVGADCDGVIYDAKTDRVLVVSGDGKSLTSIDPAGEKIAQTVALPDQPEFLAADGSGHVFINLTQTAKVAELDISTGKLLAAWPLADCKKPHGLAYDSVSRRLFSACSNGRLVVLDASTGANLADLPIGMGSDGLVFDARRHLAITSNAIGTVSLVGETSKGHFGPTVTVPTFFGGRNMTIDPTSGALFISHGDMKLVSSTEDKLKLRFGWDGLSVAKFEPAP